MADIREERIKRLQEIMSRRQDFASGKTVSDEETNNRIQALDRVYNQRYLPQQADSWTNDFTAFAKKIQTDAQSRGNKYQSQDSLTTYRDSISGQLNDLIDRSKYAKKYAESSGNTAYQSYIDESIKYLTDIDESLQKEQDYWGQWADEDAYKKSPAYFANEFGEEAKKYNGGALFSTGLATAGQNIADNGRDIYEAIMGVKYDSFLDNLYASSNGSGWDYINRQQAAKAINKDEADLYWLLRDKVSKEEADRYYKTIRPRLADRAAAKESEKLMESAGDNQFWKDTLATLYSIPAGYSSAMTGIGNAVLLPFGETAAPDVAGKTHQYNKQNLSDVGGVFADLGYTSGNMLPSIAVSYATGNPLLGAGITAMSSGGNAYEEAISQGYSREQATAYGVINGVLEGGLQYALGGIGKLGGKLSGKLINKIGDKLLPAFSNIKSGVARAILSAGGKYLGKAASEAFEEGLQAILDPLVRNMVFQEDNNIDWNEVGYSAMLGAMSAGLWEGGSIVFNSARANAIGKKAFDNGSWQGAVDYALALDPNSTPYKLAKGLQDGSIKADGNNVGNLYSALVEYMQESSKLVRKGKMTTDQYVSAKKAIAQIYEARTQAETKATQGAETAQNNIPANVLNNDIYNAVKAVQANEKAAIRQANAIARILNGDSSVSSAQIDEVSGKNSSVRNVLKSATGIDLGITNADARKAVKAYISEKAAAVNVQPSEQAQESNPGMTAQQTEYDKTVKESDKLSAVFGEKGQAAYKEFSKGMKLSDSLLYFTDAFIRFYNQGVEAASKKNSPKKYRDINGFEGISSLIKQRAYEAGLEDAKNKSGTIAEFVQKAHEVTEKAAQDEKEIKERQKAAKKVAAKQFSVDELAPTAGKWNIDPKIDMGNLSEKQSASLNYLKTVSEVSGMNITLMSGIDANGDFSVENGYYDGTTNTVYVSINAGMQSIADITHSAMLKTAAHEITHYIAKSGTDAYTMLEDYIVNEFIMEYGKGGLARRISDIQEAYKDALNKDLTYKKAKEEMVANACEMMLKNSNTFEKLAMNNMTLAQKLKAGLDSFVSKFNSNKNAALEGLEATSVEARMLARSESSLKTAQKLWDNALKGAIKENQNKVPDSKVTNTTTEVQNSNVMQNLRTMTEDYWAYRNDVVLKGLMTSQEYDKLFNSINVIMDMARKNPDILDFGADIDSNNRPFSAIKPNSDPLYKVSLDFSTLCRKRLLQQAIVNRLQAKLKRSLTATEQTQIRNELVKLRKEGKKIEVACALCYVEAARLKSPDVINDFLENRRKYAVDYFSKKNKEFNKLIAKKQGDYLASQGIKRDAKKSEMGKDVADYLDTNKPIWRQSYKPTANEEAAIKILEDMDAAELLSVQGLAKLRLANPVAYDIYISRVRTATKSKAQETNMPFKRGDTYGFVDGNGKKTKAISKKLIADMNAENGLRYQSWSDFQAMHILDNIAAVMELATRGAKMQTYTKVPDFVILNGKTGMMINMSLLAKGNGFNADGSFAFDPIEGMPFEEMQKLRDQFPETAGNIIVAVSDEHLRALLASNDIDYVIPYHLSGLNENLRLMMSIEDWVDYTRTQGEKSNGAENVNGVKLWHKAPKFSEWFDAEAAAKAEDGYAFMREAAQKYLALCEERGLVPKFDEFKNEENYWKLLIDRKMVNQKTGKVILQQAVKPIFDENAITVAQNAIADEQAIKDFHEVQDSLVEQILSGDVKISRKMTAELNAMQTSLLTSDIKVNKNTDLSFQLREVKPVEPTSDKWVRSITTREAKQRFPNLWDVSAEESDTRNPTQVKVTESSYRKIYDILKQEGFDGTILDASSGLGHGTRVGLEDYGFKVDDIEPYPSKDYSPKYTDYSKLDKTYDAIISNAVLNVLPQDQRDALVVKMGQMLNPGGQMFINVRGDDVLNASSKEIINRDNLEVYITKSGSYQKGFTSKELVAYLQDALGDGYTVRADNRFGKVSAVVTKAADTDIRFELRTTDSGTKYALVTEDISKVEVPGKPDASLGAKARYILNERFRNTVLQVGENDRVYVNKRGTKEYASPAAAISADVYAAKMGAAPELDKLLKTATNVSYKADDGRHPDAVRGWKYYDVLFAVKNSNAENGYSVFDGKLNVKRIAKGELFYDITGIKEVTEGNTGQNILSSISADSSGDSNSIFDIAENVNTEFELRNDDTAFDPRRELPNALLELAQNEKERNTLLRYKENADMLNKVQLSLEQAYAELEKAKAAMDGKRMREASEAVKKAENRLNIWDKKLTEMEATKPIKELIARRESQLKEQFARGSTTRAKYRNNIKKNIRSLDAKLRTNSGQKHILKELQPVIASLLDTFTNNTSVFTRDQLEKLKYAYAQFKPDSNIVTETNNTIINGYDNQDYENDPHLYMEHYAPVIADSINAIAPVIENMRLTDLDAETLAVLDNIVSNINHIVVHSEDIFINKKATELRDIAESSLADMKQSGYTRPKLDENGTASTIKSFFEYKNTLPVYVMERLGDTVMNKLWNPLQNGAAQMVREQVSDSEFLHSMMKKYDMQDWKDDTLRVTLESGQQIVVTQEQAMYIYAVAKRENTHRGIGGKRINHLGNGGIILPKIVKENIVNEETGKTEKYLGVIPKKRKVLSQKKGIPLTDADIDAISKRLSANQKNYVDEIVSYLSTTIADRGNEVSRQLYGIDLFNEKYYIPIMSSKDYLNISFMGQTEKLIKNAGMTKALTQGANNPIVIDDFSTVVAQHLLQMERYDSLAVPLDNFNRWLNYLSYDEDAKGRRTKNGDGVRVTMEDVYGAEMQQYINQLLKDANAASTKSNNENLANRLIGKFRKNAVLASLSVAIQQPSALGRAFTYISPKYFAFRTGWTHFKDNFNEMMKYADTAFIKENGSFDPAVSTNALDDMLYMSPEGWNKVWKLFSKDGKYRDELLGKLPKAMDRITWVSIWQAVKAETADKYGNLDTNSDEFLKIAGERFDYIINRTQVYDSILSKSELMRSKSAWWKSVTSFAAEPTVAYNVLLKGAEEVSIAKGQDAKAKRTAWRFFGRSVASFLTASFFNSLLKSIVTAARKDKDDDKSYLEWYAQEFVSNFIDDSSVFKLLPLIRDVASLFEGYDLTRTDMEMVTMIKDAIEAIADSDLPIGDKLTEIIKAVGIMTGIPAENIMRDTKALYNVIVDIFDGWQTSWEGIGDAAHDAIAGVTRFDWISESASTEDKLYAAMMNGDKNAYSKYYSMIEQEFNKKPKGSYKSAESYMRSEIRKRLKESEEIKKIYEARMALDLKTYNAIKQELMDKGFIENDIMSAVNLYKEALEKEQEQQESEVQNTTEPEEEKAYFDKDLLITALEKNNGSDVEIIEQMIGDYSNKRDPEYLERRKKIRSYITGYLKPKYQDAFLASDGEELRRIAKQLQQYKKYGINYTSDDLLQWRKSAKADRQ